jgi:TfoX/Sxy family transcriptional regulator of competence genes
MATDEFLLERLNRIISDRKLGWTVKEMFGGHCFMLDDKMCFGTYQGGLMARVGPEKIEQLKEKKGASQMLHGGRLMKGFLIIEPEGYDMDEDLEFWIDQCIEFNPKAKSSKKK